MADQENCFEHQKGESCMSKKTIIWLIVAGCLVVAGLILFTSVMMVNGWDFSKLNTSELETSTYTFSEAFSAINIDTDTADVSFLPAKDGNCTVVCNEFKNARHLVNMQNNSLDIRIQNNKKWYEYIGINISSPKITVYLPKSEYDKLIINGDTGDINVPKDFQFAILDISVDTGDVTSLASISENLRIKTDTGDIRIENVSANDLNLTVSTGDTYLSNIDCENLMTEGSTGDLILKNVIAADKLSIERSTGDVKFDGCDAREIIIETDTGNVTGNLLSAKIFITETSTGSISVPQSTSGGTCSVTTSTGDIRLEIRSS